MLDFKLDCENSEKPSVIKSYSVGSNHDAELLHKNEVKRSSHSGDILS